MKLKKALVFSADLNALDGLCSGANLLAEASAAVVPPPAVTLVTVSPAPAATLAASASPLLV